jgi:vacuolar-type H+-ATPase subunit E/Vma4
MSQLGNENLTPPTSGKQSVDDIFSELSKDDTQESLDLTKPLPKNKEAEGDKPLKADDQDRKDDDVDDKDDVDDDDDEVDELKDIEEDLEEVPAEKLELMTPVRRREILKEYPDLFKKFPYLERAYYRDQQFTEILSTIEDAKEAAESHKVLQRYTEDMVEKGNVNNVLKMIKDSNPETYARVVDNYMEHLRTVDPAAHTHVQSNMVKNVILGMVETAKSDGDDDLRTAALLLNKWAFGTAKFTPPEKMAKDLKPEDKSKADEISEKEKAFNKRITDNAMQNVTTRVNNSIKSAIENNIDPQQAMTDYVKRNATRDALEKITDLIDRDTRFQTIVNKLWEKAHKANFSDESLAEVRRAFLSKAKSLLEPVLKSSRNAALKGMGKRPKEDVDDDTDKPVNQRRERIEKPTERRLSSDKDKAKLDTLRGKSSLEALNALMGD